MRKLILILMMLVMGKAFGQVYQLMPQYGYDAKRMKFDSTLQIPTVCGVPTLKSNVLKYAAIAFDSCNKRFYYYDPKLAVWDTIKGGGGGGSTDTTSLSNRINNKVDSVKRSNDSVYFYKNGIKYFAFKDSVGAGQNGRWGNDTALVILAKVHNATGTQLNRGEVIYISGANGDVASVKRANNKYDSTSATTIGMVKDNIASGDTGWVVTQGQISKINTSAFTPGDIVYLDSIDGKFTKAKELAPYHLVFIGVVERANAGNGQIYIKPQNGYETSEIHDISINNPINNQVLVYSDTQQLWKNRSVYSVVDTTSLSNRINSIDLQTVVDNGDNSTTPIYLTSLFLYDGPMDKYYNLRVADTYFEIRDDAPNDVFSVSADNSFVKFGGTNHAIIEYNTLTNDRNYYFPDTSGTFMLRSDSTLYQTKYRTDTMRTNVYTAIAAAGGGGTDTTSLSNRINTKLNISDTSVFLRDSDSSLYQTKFRSDTARTNTYTSLASKLNTSDTSVFQRKSIAAYSMLVNNTNAAANMTTTAYQTASGTYTGSITWTGTTAPSSTTDHTYRWQRVGNVVNLIVNLHYATGGNSLTQVTFDLPSDAPTPLEPSSFDVNSGVLYFGTGQLSTTTSFSTVSFYRALMRNNATNSGYELVVNGGSGNYRTAVLNLTYFAQ